MESKRGDIKHLLLRQPSTPPTESAWQVGNAGSSASRMTVTLPPSLLPPSLLPSLPLPVAPITAPCLFTLHTFLPISHFSPSLLRLSSLFITHRLPLPLFPALPPACRRLPLPPRHSGYWSNHQATLISSFSPSRVPAPATQSVKL